MKRIPLLNDRNESVAPGQDFFEYAVGGWLKNNPIPDDCSSWGSFQVLREENLLRLKEILESPADLAEKDDEEMAKKLGIFYRQGMGEEAVENQGLEPLTPFLEKINAVSSFAELIRLTAELHTLGFRPFFNFSSTPDAKNSRWVIAGLWQGGLGLFEREYYLKKENENIFNKYAAHVEKMFSLVGLADAKKSAAEVLKVEKQLAEFARAKEELRDPVKNYNKMTIANLSMLTQDFEWKDFFSIAGVGEIGFVDVGQPEYIEKVAGLIKNTDLESVKSYLTWSVILSSADFLPKALAEEKFNFYGKTVMGQKQIKERFKRIIDIMDRTVGEGIGKLYVKKYFPPGAKKRADELVKNLRETMAERIQKLEWMGGKTKEEALKKLDNFKVKIGYPDKWIDYAAFTPGKNFLETALASRRFEWQREMKKINKPVDPDEWLMSPQTVNAYYEPLKNEIVFPAGILQPPFFYEEADDALNYGGIGTVIGHEITHGFDDQGRQFDASGNLRDWWTSEDAENFKKAAERLVEQYNSASPLPGIHLNGTFTLGENIADLGGLAISYAALKKTLGKNGEKIDSLTPEQRFFLSYAQTEKNNIHEERLKLQVMTDPHSPSKFRVNIPLQNLDEFYLAFGVDESAAMFLPENKRVKIW